MKTVAAPWLGLQRPEAESGPCPGQPVTSAGLLCRTLAEMAAATSVHVVAVIEPIIQHADWFFPGGEYSRGRSVVARWRGGIGHPETLHGCGASVPCPRFLLGRSPASHFNTVAAAPFAFPFTSLNARVAPCRRTPSSEGVRPFAGKRFAFPEEHGPPEEQPHRQTP